MTDSLLPLIAFRGSVGRFHTAVHLRPLLQIVPPRNQMRRAGPFGEVLIPDENPEPGPFEDSKAPDLIRLKLIQYAVLDFDCDDVTVGCLAEEIGPSGPLNLSTSSSGVSKEFPFGLVATEIVGV